MNQELARDHLIKHSRSNKNGLFPSEVTFSGKMTNPLCGDHVELRIYTTGNLIENIGHKAQACAICSASASILCEELINKTIDEALHLGKVFEGSVMESQDKSWPADIASLACFEHLRVNPSRKMCALLPWVVLKKCLAK